MIRVVRVVVLALAAMAWPLAARADDLLIVPFFGGTFSGKATLPLFGIATPEPRELTRSMVFGVSGIWLSRGILGAEVDLAYFPRFFEPTGPQDRPSPFDNGGVTSLSGNLLLTVPVSFTRDSLRPYVVGGLGVLHVGISDVINVFPVDRDILALNLGGGAIGMLSEHAGLRFDIRRIRTVRDAPAPTSLTPILGGTGVSLSYWRATVGVTFRY